MEFRRNKAGHCPGCLSRDCAVEAHDPNPTETEHPVNRRYVGRAGAECRTPNRGSVEEGGENSGIDKATDNGGVETPCDGHPSLDKVETGEGSLAYMADMDMPRKLGVNPNSKASKVGLTF